MAERGRLGRLAAIAALAAALVTLSACSTPTAAPVAASSAASSPASSPAGVELPPAGAAPDYQLGGAYPPDARVGVVTRDRAQTPPDGVYGICYVNGFQTQPGELDQWADDLLLRDAAGEPVIDPDWPGEVILDTSSDDKRARIAAVVAPWIEGCAAAGFSAVEFDNLDTFTRTDGALALDDNLALAATLADAAHTAGLAAGQKNAAEFAADLREGAGFDFAVTEECAAYDECDAYSRVYGAAVIDVEYTDMLPRSFAEMCDDGDTPASTVLRDRDLTTPGEPDHVFQLC